jgi:outer membrane lipoprotein-sorting protein
MGMCLPFWTLVFISLTSESIDANLIAARLQARYKTAKSLQASFLEKYMEGGSVVRSEAGTAYFLRPGKMRWEYESPEKNVFLVDGKTAWFYVPADHTVTRVPAKKSGDLRTPMALLAGEMKVSRVCARVEIALVIQPDSPANAVIHCPLRGEASSANKIDLKDEAAHEVVSSDDAFFEVVRDTGELVRIIVRESGGVEVEFSFSRWQIDPLLPVSLFRFDVPKGVAIVNGELPPGNE